MMEMVLSTVGAAKDTRRISYLFHLASFVATALLVGLPAYAQDKTEEIDKIFSWATPSTPGCAVAVSLHGKLVVSRAYGLADLERDVPISPNTIFDAGSLQKQFVAAAALLLVEEGRVSLSEDIRKYIPELHDYGHTITIDHLLTHTSGLRDWTGLLMLTAEKADAFTMILRQRGLDFVPGEEWSYSNSGYVLMKEIIARTSGMSFGEFAQKRLFEPLGMKSTAYLHDMRDVVKNRALAYEKEDSRWKIAMLLDDDRGGGGLLSTAEDLVIWNEALTNSRLGAFVGEKLHEPATLSNGRTLDYTRGLAIATSPAGDEFFWHSGSADGYKSVLGRFPEHGLSFAVMCNGGDDSDRGARGIVDLFVPAIAAQREDTQAPPAADEGVDSAGLDLSSKAGLFFSESTGEPLQLAVRAGRLRVAGGPALVAMSRNRFRRWRASLGFMSQDEFELQFLSEDQFELKSMEGSSTRYRRARPFAPSAEELEAFAGRYESDEIGTIFRTEPKGDGLVVRLEHSPANSLEFSPVDRDTFQWRRMTVRFHRDENGRVVGFAYSNPVLRNIDFERVGNR